MSLPWFRLYHEFATDPKIQALSFDDQRHFVVVLCMKCNGTLDTHTGSKQFREKMIGVGLGLMEDKTAEAKVRLMDAGLIDDEWQPLAWDRRQPISDRNAAERKRNQRLREMSRDVTVTSRECHVLDSDKDIDKDSERTKKPAKRACALPEDFEITPERESYAKAKLPKVDTAEMMAAFRDYHAKEGTVAKDWDASWRTWVRNALQFGYPMLTSTQPAARQIRIDANGRRIDP